MARFTWIPTQEDLQVKEIKCLLVFGTDRIRNDELRAVLEIEDLKTTTRHYKTGMEHESRSPIRLGKTDDGDCEMFKFSLQITTF